MRESINLGVTLCPLWLMLLLFVLPAISQDQNRDWPVYLGEGSAHYSPLTQINKTNVKDLRVAWTYDTGESGGLQASPIVVHGILFGISPSQKVFALDAATGKLRWKFDSGIVGTQPARGLAYWEEGGPDSASKDHRIIVGIMNFVYEINADDGVAIASFGDHGRIDLRENLGRDPASVSIALTSPAVVYNDLFIVGGREPETLPCPPGDIRAYDLRTGKPRWSFHTIPHPGEFGYETWPKDAWKTIGSANNWAGMTLDVKTGIVYVPTGSAAFDFYGGDRLGDDLFADSEIALNAETGQRIWHFQGVKHDLWDRDFPAPPVLIDVERNGKKIQALAQTTKQGFVYVFDRANGAPLFPVEYRKYSKSDLPGEVAADDQPLPTKPAPYARQLLTEDLLTTRTPEMHQWALAQFRTFRSEGQFVPFGTRQDTVIFPGFDGGAEWGGPAFDPQTGLLYVNSNDLAWYARLAENTGDELSGRGIYQTQCTICHRDNMAGAPPNFPSLIGVGQRLDRNAIANVIEKGRGRMPAFANLTQDEINALIDYLTGVRSTQVATTHVGAGAPACPVERSSTTISICESEGPSSSTAGPTAQSVTQASPPLMRYRFSGYTRFLDPEGYPAVAPPWGTLNAINLNTGEYAWKIPLGEYPELTAKGMTNTGTENYGGPLVTAGGLLFIGATNYDKKFRAFDKSTGALLWETTLPFAGNATPITYEVNGRQYVIIAAGGGKDLKSKSGGVYVAFALDGKAQPE